MKWNNSKDGKRLNQQQADLASEVVNSAVNGNINKLRIICAAIIENAPTTELAYKIAQTLNNQQFHKPLSEKQAKSIEYYLSTDKGGICLGKILKELDRLAARTEADKIAEFYSHDVNRMAEAILELKRKVLELEAFVNREPPPVKRSGIISDYFK